MKSGHTGIIGLMRIVLAFVESTVFLCVLDKRVGNLILVVVLNISRHCDEQL